MRNTEYIIQWKYPAIKMWWTQKRSWSRARAFKFMAKRLAHHSNAAPWRIVEWNKKEDKYYVIFESSLDKREIQKYNLKQFTGEEVDNSC